MRENNRNNNEIREVRIEPEVLRHAEGSADICFGNTRVICTASVEPKVPKWLQGSGEGWVTGEYGMLPRSTHTRIRRDKAANSGRSQEISRLIGRSLRSAVDLKALGEKQINVDCDVIQADGGTRTAAITGGFVALSLALKFLMDQGEIQQLPIKNYISAISVGLRGSDALLDLNYEEDFSCGADTNFVLDSIGNFVEVQGTAEGQTISRSRMNEMMDLAESGCRELFRKQAAILGDFLPLKES